MSGLLEFVLPKGRCGREVMITIRATGPGRVCFWMDQLQINDRHSPSDQELVSEEVRPYKSMSNGDGPVLELG